MYLSGPGGFILDNPIFLLEAEYVLLQYFSKSINLFSFSAIYGASIYAEDFSSLIMQSFTFGLSSGGQLESGYFYLDSKVTNSSLEVYDSDITFYPQSVDGNGGKYVICQLL